MRAKPIGKIAGADLSVLDLDQNVVAWRLRKDCVEGNGMALFMIVCPTTGRKASTGIRIADWTWNSGPEFYACTRCFTCGRVHQWSAKDVILCDEAEAARFAAIPLESALGASEIVSDPVH